MEVTDGSSVQKPTSLQLRHSNNTMIDKAVIIPQKDTNGDKKCELNDNAVDTAVNEIKNFNSIEKDSTSTDQTCAIFGQIIDNEDETWDLLSDVASWESSFPKEIFNDSENHCTPTSLESEIEELPKGWKKVSDSAGNYYWNIETGKTQPDPPTSGNASVENSFIETSISASKNEDRVDEKTFLVSSNSREGHMFLVRSLGWLPMEHENLRPDVSSAAVNSCIRLLSNNRSQIMDGVGVWGEGMDLMLIITNNLLKIVDPLENTVLQSQPIKHIRIWGVGRDSSHDFAYVVRDPSTKIYKCHVFRCDAPAHSIAKQIHTICSGLVKQRKLSQNKIGNGLADRIPIASAESYQTFHSKYIGSVKVSKPNGIDILKQAMHQLMNDTSGKDVKVTVSPSTLIMFDSDNIAFVNCRMRCLSFMGVGDDVQLFGFISVIASEATCHVLQCFPNAAKLALAVQEACMLRYQKAIDSNQTVKCDAEPQQNSKSLKSKVMKIFSGFRRSRS